MTKIHCDSATCCAECDGVNYDACTCRDGWNDACQQHGQGRILALNEKTPLTYRWSIQMLNH